MNEIEKKRHNISIGIQLVCAAIIIIFVVVVVYINKGNGKVSDSKKETDIKVSNTSMKLYNNIDIEDISFGTKNDKAGKIKTDNSLDCDCSYNSYLGYMFNIKDNNKENKIILRFYDKLKSIEYSGVDNSVHKFKVNMDKEEYSFKVICGDEENYKNIYKFCDYVTKKLKIKDKEIKSIDSNSVKRRYRIKGGKVLVVYQDKQKKKYNAVYSDKYVVEDCKFVSDKDNVSSCFEELEKDSLESDNILRYWYGLDDEEYSVNEYKGRLYVFIGDKLKYIMFGIDSAKQEKLGVSDGELIGRLIDKGYIKYNETDKFGNAVINILGNYLIIECKEEI